MIGSGLLAASSPAQSLLVDFVGASIPSSGTPPNIIRTTTATIAPASGYQFAFNPRVHGTGFLGGAVVGGTAANPRFLGDVLNDYFAGGHRTLYGAMRNRGNTLPVFLDTETVGGTFGNITLSLVLRHELLADGRGRTSITEIDRPSSVGLAIDSGGTVIMAWTPPAPVVSEWHFEGNLLSVKESLAAPASGPARLRYLDDSSFGPILGGEGVLDTYPNPPTPTNVTLAQSSFAAPATFGIAPVPGSTGLIETVYKTSPPRNAAAPTDSARRRGLGLSLWPNSRDYWPADRLGQWTMVWDILIPASS